MAVDALLETVPKTVRNCIMAVCERAGTYDADWQVLKAVGDVLASSPAWHDRPTGPGLWFAPKASTKLFGLLARDFDRNPEWFADWPGGRVFGPIPADEETQAGMPRRKAAEANDGQ